MLEPLLLPSGALLRLGNAELLPERVTVDVHTTATSAVCPGCRSDACRVHSRYQRTLADLPLAHIPVCLHLYVQRFFCDNGLCLRKTFSEPVPGLTLPRARRTTRLLVEQRHLGLEVGGEPGARLARRQGMAVSADTLLRLARREPTTSAPPPRHLGIDDFALRKGQVYGTILVDLEAHQPVDLIPERSAEVVEEWLQAHPGVEVITRDRSGEYVEGASRGAPNALQVADRFHLLQNVREMLQRLLDGQQKALQATTQEPASSSDTQPGLERQTSVAAEALAEPVSAGVSKLVPVPVEPPSLPLSKAAQLSQARRARRHDRYTAVRELHAQGVGLRAIAAQLQLSRNTVRRYVAADQFPEQATRRPRRRLLEPFIPYLEAQLAAGQENALQLWRELREHHRYTGSRALVSRWVAQHRHLVPLPEPNSPPRRQRGRPPAASAPPATPPQHRLSARQAAWLLVREPKKLEEEEQRLVERLCTHAPKVEQAYRLAQEFMQMVRERQAERFDDWLQRASTSGLAELQGFVVGLERDKAAVVAALSLPYSNGQVEGQVNRLKLIKRSMYGRAKFDLLRQRVLARSS